MGDVTLYDAVVVGGGPAGATAAADLARLGHTVVLLDRAGRIKPCGGAIPPRLLKDFELPDHLLVARATAARIVSPRNRHVPMPVEGGFVGMVDREVFDDWLRRRAAAAGAVLMCGTFERHQAEAEGIAVLTVRTATGPIHLRTRAVIGADGALSEVARQCVPHRRTPMVVAYHEVVVSPEGGNRECCDIYYRGVVSPDFYGWVFPHGASTSVGTGSARKGFALRGAVDALRTAAGLADAPTLRREGAPIPLRILRRWDDGRSVVLAGDAAGVVAPASGEGIFYAMTSGRLAADAVADFLHTGNAGALRSARRRFMAQHGGVFRALGVMQRIFYANDWLRERFVALCGDRMIQRLVWRAYLDKAMTRQNPMTVMRVLGANLAEFAGWRAV